MPQLYPSNTEITTLDTTTVSSTNTGASDYNFFANMSPFQSSRLRGFMRGVQQVNAWLKNYVSPLLNAQYLANAYLLSNQSISAGATVTINWTETSDPNNNFASNTYTVPYTGTLEVKGSVGIFSSSSGSRLIGLRRNGGLWGYIQERTTSGDAIDSFAVSIPVTAGDTITVIAFCSVAANVRQGATITFVNFRMVSL